jgi:hypothetical protein
MRNFGKILALIFVTVFCCNVVNINSHQISPEKNSQESRLSVAPLSDGSQAIEARNLNFFFSTLPDLVQKNKKEISSALIASALSKVNCFSGYIFYASNLIVRIETTDLIFPFHFFW